jgi:uncharacterized protein
LRPATSISLSVTHFCEASRGLGSLRACSRRRRGMTHPFLEAVASELGDRGIASLRYNFPFVDRRSKRPDPPALAHATVRAAVTKAADCSRTTAPSRGEVLRRRMTSQAQASSPPPAVRGLVFLGFPLHAAKRPSAERAAHLFDAQIPMLFLQGTRDDQPDLDHLRPLCERLGDNARQPSPSGLRPRSGSG